MRRITTLITLCLACGPGTSLAQSSVTTADVFISLNGGLRMMSQTRTDSVTFDLFAEKGKFDATQTIGPFPVVDASYARRLGNRYGVAVSGSFVQGTAIATIDASVPHPFFFEFPREATGMSSRLQQREIGAHISGQLRMPLPLGGLLVFSAGPTIFQVAQDFTTGILTTERGFPFENVDIRPTTVERQAITAIGYHAGLDAIFDVSGRYGVGVLVRYSRARPAVILKGEFQPGLALGRLQVLAGARIGF